MFLAKDKENTMTELVMNLNDLSIALPGSQNSIFFEHICNSMNDKKTSLDIFD